MGEQSSTPAAVLAQEIIDSTTRLLELVSDLTDEQWLVPRMPIVNPPRWEVGHVTWFNELWVLRNLFEAKPLIEDADGHYNSIIVPHETRWDLPLPSRQDTLSYLKKVLERCVERIGSLEPSDKDAYFYRLSTYHSDMHVEAITYTRQTLGYPPPQPNGSGQAPADGQPDAGFEYHDVEVPGGTFLLGAEGGAPFVFDNEKWAHPVEVAPFRMAATAVTNGQYLAFVEDGGYGRQELWSPAGWGWRGAQKAEHPVYWRREADGRWLRRRYDTWAPLEEHLPVLHVNWFEANAYCAWAGRRLPTEAEWEMAASAEPTAVGRGITGRKRRFPWGDEAPSSERANLDAAAGQCVDVRALPAGDSAFGCRQMMGNVWEWTGTDFGPYPGFVLDPYKEYSAPWFWSHKVLRGGCWTTRARLIRNTWRNFYTPERRDVWAGFRTCAL